MSSGIWSTALQEGQIFSWALLFSLGFSCLLSPWAGLRLRGWEVRSLTVLSPPQTDSQP